MTDEDRTGGLATAGYVAYMLTLFLLGVQAARYIVFVIYCVLEYRNGK